MSDIIAILCSDIHLSFKAPSFRSEEPNWFDAMKRSIDELRFVAEKHEAPIICAGDVWDKYLVPPEVINWAIRTLPKMICVPGQHDLPFHRLDDLRKSAYYTLMEAGIIRNLEEPMEIDGLMIYPFPWGVDPKPLENPQKGKIHLAVVHRYIWKDYGASFPGAEERKKTTGYVEMLRGYDAAVFGDNHIGFNTFVGSCEVINCGTFFKRKSDEVGYKPQIGLLFEDGQIVPHYLDTSKDIYLSDPLKQKEDGESIEEIKDFLKELKSLGADSLDFREALKRKMELLGTDDEVKALVNEAVG